jgi:predicted PurR-regulated permease PerM
MKINSRTIILILSFLASFAVIYYFSDLVAYVVVAWVVSMVGQPLMDFLKKYMNRNIAALLTLFSFILIFTGLVWIFVPSVVEQARNLAGIDYENVINSLEEPLNDWNEWLVDRGLMQGTNVNVKDTIDQNNIPEVLDTINLDLTEQAEHDYITSKVINLDSILEENGDTTSKTNIALWINIQNPNKESDESETIKDPIVLDDDSFFDRIKKNLYSSLNPAKIPELFGSILSMVGNLMIAIMAILFTAFFFLREEGLFLAFLKAVVPKQSEAQVAHALEETSKLLIRYFVGVAAQITIITVFVSLALTLFGVKNALLIGFFAALMNVIPYIGPIIGASFGVIITLSSNLELNFYSQLLPLLLIVVLVFAVMQLFDNLILQPKIFSRSVKAHPLEIFIVVMAGAKVGGILGMVLAIPVYTVIRVIAKVFLSEFKLVKKLTDSI